MVRASRLRLASAARLEAEPIQFLHSMITRPDDIKLELPYREIEALCRAYDVVELSIFGSALRDDFRPDSDVDFLVVFKDNDLGPWMGKLTDFQDALGRLLNRKVDAVPRSSIEQSKNYIRRRRILGSARTIYVA